MRMVAHSCSDAAIACANRGSEPTSCIISWSEVTPIALRAMTTGTSSDMVLCRSANLPDLQMMCVFDLRSCVDDVTAAWMLSCEAVVY